MRAHAAALLPGTHGNADTYARQWAAGGGRWACCGRQGAAANTRQEHWEVEEVCACVCVCVCVRVCACVRV